MNQRLSLWPYVRVQCVIASTIAIGGAGACVTPSEALSQDILAILLPAKYTLQTSSSDGTPFNQRQHRLSDASCLGSTYSFQIVICLKFLQQQDKCLLHFWCHEPEGESHYFISLYDLLQHWGMLVDKVSEYC